MNETPFVRLLTQLARHCNCDADRLLVGERTLINGTAFRFDHDEAESPDTLLVCCEYGDLPERQRTDAIAALLEANMLLFFNRGSESLFSLSPEDGKVWLLARLRLSRLTPQELSRYLAQTAEQARLWRQDHFLGPERTESAVPAERPYALGLGASLLQTPAVRPTS
ncbi:CesT family type III secretion system chaperone [Pseudomonas indica]|uniref:Tir chaperone protein (CesT) family protein n=1 Tax=Pseudomonas indica TaxID=137658 RepID=A0A1G9CLZ4_9PSED|nr:CesT family type III secretion system chaperone [Pseudomonas indica]SDK52710.1 Tir chaperone protein (CesT) family protein [Pseudomonas indica]